MKMDDVVHAYRWILGREPESIEKIQSHLTASEADYQQLRARFLSSPEFYRNNARQILRFFSDAFLNQRHEEIEFECSNIQMTKLLNHISTVWSTLGEVEPHFSVCSTTNYKPESISVNIESFLNSGAVEVRSLQSQLQGLGLRDQGFNVCIELGCGVGRVTKALAGIADKVIGYDVSKPHIELGHEYLTKEKVENVELVKINSIKDFSFPENDLFFSTIVLQHNPPPIQYLLINKALSALKKEGIAVFQTPTYLPGYSFKTEEYILEMEKLDNQEIHALPMRAVCNAIYNNQCELINIGRDDWLSDISQVSTRFVVYKP